MIKLMLWAAMCSIPLDTGEVVTMPCEQGEANPSSEASPFDDTKEWIVLPEGQEVDPREIR